jgi:threonine aldolase
MLGEISGIVVDQEVQTNMVFCRVKREGRSEEGLVSYLAARGFNNYPPEWWGLRFVLSSEVDEGDVRAFVEATRAYMQGDS